jgi:hypothetical protein
MAKSLDINRDNRDVRYDRVDEINEIYAQQFGRAFLSNKSTIKAHFIEDLPVLVKKDGTVVCIPKLPEMGVIASLGMTGMGKTLTAGLILDEIYWNWKDNLAVLNDSQEETFTWCYPAEERMLTEMSLNSTGQKPMPLPMVYVFPSSDEFEMDESDLHDKCYVTISIPFEEIIENLEKYMPDLAGSAKYILEKKDELLECTTEEEVYEIVESIPETSKGIAAVKQKVRVLFKNLMTKGMINISRLNVPCRLHLNGELYNPFVALMKAGAVPSFVTSDLYNRNYKDAIFAYHLNSLFQENLSGDMKGNRVWIYFDELTRVVNSNSAKSCLETEMALNNIASRGRNNKISLIYTTQGYHEIPNGIRNQTKFAVVFRHKKMEEVKSISDDFSLNIGVRKEILRLKKFEAYLVTTEYLVCYKGSKKWIEQGPIKGTIIPSLHLNKFAGAIK